jgi:hypothetical protein
MKSLLVLILAFAICFSAYASTDVRNGVWTAELQGDDRIDLTVFHGKEQHRSIMSFDEPLSHFVGLSKADLTSSAANVQFELRRPAGTIAFEGRVANGTGAGHYHFTPSESFLRAMDTFGYPDFKDEELLIFALHDFSPQTIRDLRAMGYQPTQREVVEIAIFRITPDFLREMSGAGYANLSLREAVNFRVGRVDAAYIKQMRQLGYTNLTARQLADMAILGVTPKYISELKALGYADLTARQLTDMRVFGVTPEYIRKLADNGYHNVPVEKLLKLRQMGADKILGLTADHR